jgi:S-adenosylmethionine:tRNA ribosyltransferase-isomerase
LRIATFCFEGRDNSDTRRTITHANSLAFEFSQVEIRNRSEPMLLSQFDYSLPPELIAQAPPPQREASRLLVLDRRVGTIAHRRFSDVLEYLRAGDVLVINDTRVIPARLFGTFEAGGSVEILLVRPVGDDCWEAMVKPAKPARVGRRLELACGHLPVTVETLGIHGRRILRLPTNVNLRTILDAYGVMPLPPYIKRKVESREAGKSQSGQSLRDFEEQDFADGGDGPHDSGVNGRLDRDRYQTVYAREDGAVAAPTAGLHFTEDILAQATGLGAQLAPITLHVGPGTFLPVRAEAIADHQMEAERYTISEATAETVNTAKAEGRRVIAVGTTSVRTLEHAARLRGRVRAGVGSADLFITPGFRFRIVTTFLTNFHLPRSTPLILVAAFAGLDRTRQAYDAAIAERYRFYSYGDAMLIV